MPRKSLFRRNKNKEEKKGEQETEDLSLKRSTQDPTSLNIDEIKNFNQNISEDGMTLEINAADFALPEPEIKKPALKKERKSRRNKRRTKAFISAEQLQSVLTKIADIDVSDALDKFYVELEKLKLPTKAMDVIKQAISKIKEGEDIIDYVIDNTKKVAFNITDFVSNVTPIIENLIDEIKNIPKEDDIMAKLAALEAERQVVITPEPVKEEPKPEPVKEEQKDDIMAKLAALEAARNIVVVNKPKSTPQPVMKELTKEAPKPVARTESENEKLVLNGKTYNIKIKLQPDDNDVVVLNLLNDESSDVPLHIKIDRRKKELSLHEFANGKWARCTKQKLRKDDITIKVKIGKQVIPIQAQGMFQKNYRRIKGGLINKMKWTMKNITIN